MEIIGAHFLEDIDAVRYSYKKKSFDQVVLSFRQDVLEICIKAWKTNKLECSVSLCEIKEVRLGKKSKDFERWAAETKKTDSNKCFVILYGSDFRLKTLSLASLNSKDAEAWTRGLEFLITTRPVNYLKKLDIWTQKEYELSSHCSSGLTLKQLKDFTTRVNYKICIATVREHFEKHAKNGRLAFPEFSILVTTFLHNQQIFTDCLGQYSIGGRVELSGFRDFLLREQRQLTAATSDYDCYFREYLHCGAPGIPYMNRYEAVNFLFSKDNQVWNEKTHGSVYQDMTRPLSHYWIASSHNTYLTGDQVSSESSVEAYIRCLRQGCRCLELDCWDGPNGTPIIYHGRTLTTKISFLEVINAIKEHAFVTSEYPVILSIENHCSIKQQKVMAKKFEEVFGKMLVTQPLSNNETCLPSPYDLRHRILLKCKSIQCKFRESTGRKDSSSDNDSDSALNICDTIKNGKMHIRNSVKEWEPYFFALTANGLIYTKIEERRDSDVDRHDIRVMEELHSNEEWFHGKIEGGSAEAQNRLIRLNVEGGFLVRESETFPGSYTLDFLSQGKVHHIRIQSDENQTQYSLVSDKKFDSLYSLIMYYKENPLETKNFRIERFTEAAIAPEKHENLPWFYPNPNYPGKMTRKEAEAILQKIPLNGAFLVRRIISEENVCGSPFAITFRVENRLKNCRIKQDGRLFYVYCNKKFNSLEKLVSHYSKNPFYGGIFLKHPVTEELIKFAFSVENPSKVYTSPDYIDTSMCEEPIQAKAINDYNTAHPETLSFRKGDIITNIIKDDDIWWQGDLGDQVKKYFPASFVEEIITENHNKDSPFGQFQKGSIKLGKVDIEKGPNTSLPWIVKVGGSGISFRAAVTSLKEAKEWQDAIEYVRQSNDKKSLMIDKIHKKQKIAKELSKLIVYCKAVPKITPEVIKKIGRNYNEMTSYNELTAKKLMQQDPAIYAWYHETQLTRVYPKGQRVDSSNYNPVSHWIHGCQMVSLNYQTPDRSMQLNHGKFRGNGKCGYILKPDFMMDPEFEPNNLQQLIMKGMKPYQLKITTIAARHLSRPGTKSVANPYVEIEIVGADFDCQKVRTKKENRTFTVEKTFSINATDMANDENGLNPYWNEKYKLHVMNPQLALIRFAAMDEDSFGDPQFLGQATYPVHSLREGYRSVPLESGFGEPLLGTILIHLEINS